MKTEAELNAMAEAIVNTRDLCGDERAAAKDWCRENGVTFTREVYAEAVKRADATWRASQAAAGAKILTAEERAEACDAIEERPVGRRMRL